MNRDKVHKIFQNERNNLSFRIIASPKVIFLPKVDNKTVRRPMLWSVIQPNLSEKITEEDNTIDLRELKSITANKHKIQAKMERNNKKEALENQDNEEFVVGSTHHTDFENRKNSIPSSSFGNNQMCALITCQLRLITCRDKI